MPTAGTVISGHENSLRKIISGGCRLTFTEQMETPAHSGAESGAILGFNGLLRLSEDSVKSLFVRDGQIGKNLAVQIDIGGFQAFHKAGIGQTAVTHGSGSSAWVERFRGSGERQVLLDCPDLRFVHQSHLAKLTLALAGLLLEDVALALFAAQYLARAGNLETLGDCLASFIDTTFAGHGGKSIGANPLLASGK